jgi:hypothetical protein
MTSSSKTQKRSASVTQKQLVADAGAVIRQVKRGPVVVTDAQGRARMVLCIPKDRWES